MNWLSLAQTLIPLAISIAESAHPQPNSGTSKLQTATNIVQGTLGAIANATGSTPPSTATDRSVLGSAISSAVALANALGGVQKHGPSTTPQ